jgi:hypothetical protein
MKAFQPCVCRPIDASQFGPSSDWTGKPVLSRCCFPGGIADTRMSHARFTEDRLLSRAGLQRLFTFGAERTPQDRSPAHFQGAFRFKVGIRFAFAILVSGKSRTLGANPVWC